mgnify:CR=1 FL=1
MYHEQGELEWATAELLAMGTLVTEGTPVRLAGEEKDFTTVWLTLHQRTLQYETYVMPAPEENHAAVYEQLLRRNLRFNGAAFAIGDEDAFIGQWIHSSGGQIYNNIVVGLGTLLAVRNNKNGYDTQLDGCYIGYNTFVAREKTRVAIGLVGNMAGRPRDVGRGRHSPAWATPASCLLRWNRSRPIITMAIPARTKPTPTPLASMVRPNEATARYK